MQRPYVIVGGNMSVDGKTATVTGDGSILARSMGAELVRRLHLLRSSVDAVIVGIETIIKNDPRLTVRAVEGRNPMRIVFDSMARTPLGAHVVDVEEAETIIFVSRSAPRERVKALEAKGVKVLECGSDRVDVSRALGIISEMGLRRVLVEGGGRMRWSFFKEGVVDELFLYVTPMIIGGSNAPTLVDGEGFMDSKEAIRLKLASFEVVDGTLVLRYFVER
ncbi:MAG: 2,5-diamino-6-(ribosylamino)-4(3H)-pyrimidinone 5'-phosphate reductase [Candidatus Bathyarchaeia archaeon]